LKKKFRKVKEQITRIFELPAESIEGAYRIITIGDKSLYMENHMAIREYTLKKLRIETKKNEVIIMGNDLILRKMGERNLMVEGDIKIIEFKD